MGTNFYVEFTGPRECEHCGVTSVVPQQIHLGKSSVGWAFLFHADANWTADDAYDRWLALLDKGHIISENQDIWTRDELLERIAKTANDHRQLFPGQFVDDAGRVWDAAEFC